MTFDPDLALLQVGSKGLKYGEIERNSVYNGDPSKSGVIQYTMYRPTLKVGPFHGVTTCKRRVIGCRPTIVKWGSLSRPTSK